MKHELDMQFEAFKIVNAIIEGFLGTQKLNVTHYTEETCDYIHQWKRTLREQLKQRNFETGRPGPIKKAVNLDPPEKLYYIRSMYGDGQSADTFTAIWYKTPGHGLTENLEEAGKYTYEDAEASISGGDLIYPVDRIRDMMHKRVDRSALIGVMPALTASESLERKP